MRIDVCIVLFTVLVCSVRANVFYKRLISIPNKLFDGDLWMGCTSMPIDANQFVAQFEPVVTKGIVHHMSIHVCDVPYSEEYVWDCVDPVHVCGRVGRQALFEWGRNAPAWVLPDYAGIPTGNRKRHLVLQVHIEQGFKPSSVEGPYKFSGIEVTLRDSQPVYEVAMGVWGNTGYIPPNVKGFTTDSACAWDHNITAPIFAYSIHTHEFGKAVTTWIYRNDSWIEIGRADPRYPEILMDVSKKGLQLVPGDTIALRCTYDNPQDKKVVFGSDPGGEMCNVYLHYGVPHDTPEHMRTTMCSASAQHFRWEDHFDSIPSKASDPSGDTDQAYYIKRYKWKVAEY